MIIFSASTYGFDARVAVKGFKNKNGVQCSRACRKKRITTTIQPKESEKYIHHAMIKTRNAEREMQTNNRNQKQRVMLQEHIYGQVPGKRQLRVDTICLSLWKVCAACPVGK